MDENSGLFANNSSLFILVRIHALEIGQVTNSTGGFGKVVW